ncbi:MAG: hypothetical protein WBL21_04625 [Salinimicrobium sp.]
MEQLSIEEISFIDNYLKNSGVEYLDVRIEMTDHVASAIEKELEPGSGKSFYHVFKWYMVKNKKSLLKSATRQRWSVDRKVLLNIRKESLKAPLLLIGFGLIAIFSNANIAELENSRWFIVPLAIVILTAYVVPVVYYFKLKISFLNRLSFYAYFVNYLFYLLFVYFEPSEEWVGLCYGLLVWLNCGILVSAFKMSAFYQKQFSQYEKAR